jgi:hypothetical protein
VEVVPVAPQQGAAEPAATQYPRLSPVIAPAAAASTKYNGRDGGCHHRRRNQRRFPGSGMAALSSPTTAKISQGP